MGFIGIKNVTKGGNSDRHHNVELERFGASAGDKDPHLQSRRLEGLDFRITN